MSTGSSFGKAALIALTTLVSEGAISKEQGSKETEGQIHYPLGSQPSFTGPEDKFTGDVSVQVLFPGTDETDYSGAYVTFSAGAHTAWHSHPAGQHMVVTEGKALTGTRDGKVYEFSEGETVWCPSDIDHWHGATPHSSMTHLVITNSKDGENVTWKKTLSDDEYQAALKQIAQATDIEGLSVQERNLVRVAAYAAADQQEGLKIALNDALDSGVTISELRESLIHLYSYTGFPRSLNALGNLMGVVESRREAGKKDTMGAEPSAIAADKSSREVGEQVQTELVGQKVSGPLFEFAPGINDYLQSHLFGDIFARGVLDYKQRELLTVAILASLDGTESQLNAHIGIATNTGVSQVQLQGVAETLAVYKGRKYAARVTGAVDSVLGKQ